MLVLDLLGEQRRLVLEDGSVVDMNTQTELHVRIHIGVSAHNMPGSNLHQEMWYLWKGGMSIKNVLRATTVGNARKLGLQEEIGSLEPGKIADFLVLEGNPLDNILNTLSLKYTVQGGVVYDPSTTRPADLTRVGKRPPLP